MTFRLGDADVCVLSRPSDAGIYGSHLHQPPRAQESPVLEPSFSIVRRLTVRTGSRVVPETNRHLVSIVLHPWTCMRLFPRSSDADSIHTVRHCVSVPIRQPT